MIEASGLCKTYGETRALQDVDLSVPAGSILGVLGPNGAGKTTALRILTTLTTPDAGRARVAGQDVTTEAPAVRRSIGVTGQSATLDDALTGRQNLMMVGELSGLRRRDARRRSLELLAQFELTDAADRIVKGYSGGMRRRLDLAASLVSRPPVLVLDEPTTGLDPTSRQRMWSVVRELVMEGVTVLLTTQYLDEADALADRIVVFDHGRVIAEGTPFELKAATGSQMLEVTLLEPSPGAEQALAAFSTGKLGVSDDGRRLWTPARSADGLAVTVLRALDDIGARVDDIAVHRPSLDEVFALLTDRAGTTKTVEEGAPA